MIETANRILVKMGGFDENPLYSCSVGHFVCIVACLMREWEWRSL